MAQTTLRDYMAYELRCAYCRELLEKKATISSIISEEVADSPYNHKLTRLLCNHDCLLRLRLNGNRSIDGSAGRMYYPSSKLANALSALEYRLEAKNGK